MIPVFPRFRLALLLKMLIVVISLSTVFFIILTQIQLKTSLPEELMICITELFELPFLL